MLGIIWGEPDLAVTQRLLIITFAKGWYIIIDWHKLDYHFTSQNSTLTI